MCCSAARWGLIFFLPLPYKHLCKNKTHFPGGSLEELTTVPSGHWPRLCPCHEHFVGLNPCLQHQPNDSAPKTNLQKPQTLTLQGKHHPWGLRKPFLQRIHTLWTQTPLIRLFLLFFFFFIFSYSEHSFHTHAHPGTLSHWPAGASVTLSAGQSRYTFQLLPSLISSGVNSQRKQRARTSIALLNCFHSFLLPQLVCVRGFVKGSSGGRLRQWLL